jgi:hypothetical protein
MSSGLPGAKLLSSKMAPSAPVFVDLHCLQEDANQSCCSITGTKTLLRQGHTARAIHPHTIGTGGNQNVRAGLKGPGGIR